MRKNVENKLRKKVEDRSMACPFCDEHIPWSSVSPWYCSQIGSMNHGRPMSSEEGKRMVMIRWARSPKAKRPSENNKA